MSTSTHPGFQRFCPEPTGEIRMLLKQNKDTLYKLALMAVAGTLLLHTDAAFAQSNWARTVVLPKAEVAKVELLETSMMPEGLISGLPDVQMRDLLYYLTRPGQVPLPAGN